MARRIPEIMYRVVQMPSRCGERSGAVGAGEQAAQTSRVETAIGAAQPSSARCKPCATAQAATCARE